MVFAAFLYGMEKVERDTLVSAFLKIMVQGDEGYDEDCEVSEALQGLATAIQAMFPARNQKTNELTGTIKGEDAEKLFFKYWVIAYVNALKLRGFHPDNPIEGETGKMNPKDEKQAIEFREQGNSPDWDNPVANGSIEAPRWLIAKAGSTVGEIDGMRAADFYKYAQERAAEKDETRDPETKGDPA